MYSFSIANNKGGVGKTTMSVSIASQLAKNGKRVLLVDCDPQGNSSSSLLQGYNFEFADVLLGKCSPEEAVMPTQFENLFVLPTIALDDSDVNALNKLRMYKQTMAANNPNAIRKLVKILNDKFDYCIFDTCPAFDNFEENIYSACNEIITVLLMDIFSMDGLQIFQKNLENFSERKEFYPKFSKIILNSCNQSMKMHKRIISEMDSRNDFDCFVVPQDQAFKRSQDLQTPVQFLTKEQGFAKEETLNALETICNFL